MGEVARFTGFPTDALDFFDELEGNNERPWWQANKERFDASVAEPMRALLDRLEPEFGVFKVFRMNRDVRFSADKSPYKTAHAAVTHSDRGSATYVQFSANGLYAGGGMYHMARDQLERFRTAVADDKEGTELEAALVAARRARLDIAAAEPPLATAPRGWPKDHPRIALLRMRGLITGRELGTPAWLHTSRAANEVAKVWRSGADVNAWLDANVGPSEEPLRSR
jgi:uncharacterized protein (TIGR02453 family)